MVGDPEYSVGNLVQIAYLGKGYQVIWRGEQKVRMADGSIGRRWVYRLDNGHWDCYYEEELQPFGRWDRGHDNSWHSS